MTSEKELNMSDRLHALAIVRGAKKLQEMRRDINRLFEMLLLEEFGKSTRSKECPTEMKFKVYETEKGPVYITFYFENSSPEYPDCWHIRVKMDTITSAPPSYDCEFKAKTLPDETVVKLHDQLTCLVEAYLERFPEKRAHFEFLAKLDL